MSSPDYRELRNMLRFSHYLTFIIYTVGGVWDHSAKLTGAVALEQHQLSTASRQVGGMAGSTRALPGSGAGRTTELGTCSTAVPARAPKFLVTFSGQAAAPASFQFPASPDASPVPFAPNLCPAPTSALDALDALDASPQTSNSRRRARDCGARLGMTVDARAHSHVPPRRNT